MIHDSLKARIVFVSASDKTRFAGLAAGRMLGLCGAKCDSHICDEDFAPAAAAALVTCDILLTVGGLGENDDYSAKRIFSEGLGLELLLDRYVHARAVKSLAERGRVPDRHIDTVCSFPAGSRVLFAGGGLACGFVLDTREQLIIALPEHSGHAAECLAELPKILTEFTGRPIFSDRFEIFGREPELFDRAIARSEKSVVLPSTAGFTTSVSVYAADPSELELTRSALAAEFASRLYGKNRESPVAAAGKALLASGVRAALCEAGTEGYVAGKLLKAPELKEVLTAFRADTPAQLRGLGVGRAGIKTPNFREIAEKIFCPGGIAIAVYTRPNGDLTDVFLDIFDGERHFEIERAGTAVPKLVAAAEVCNILRLFAGFLSGDLPDLEVTIKENHAEKRSARDTTPAPSEQPDSLAAGGAAARDSAPELPDLAPISEPPEREAQNPKLQDTQNFFGKDIPDLPEEAVPDTAQANAKKKALLRNRIALAAASAVAVGLFALVKTGAITLPSVPGRETDMPVLSEDFLPDKPIFLPDFSRPISADFQTSRPWKFETAVKINPDAAGAVKIGRDYEVFFAGEDNDYYLYRNMFAGEGRASRADVRSDLSGGGDFAVHLEGETAGDLAEYTQLYKFEESPYISMFDGRAEQEFRVAAVFVYDPAERAGDGFAPDEFFEGDREVFLESVAARSLISSDVKISSEEPFVLITFPVGHFDGARAGILARPPLPGESREPLTAEYNPNVLYPAKYYEQYPEETIPSVFWKFEDEIPQSNTPAPPIEPPPAATALPAPPSSSVAAPPPTVTTPEPESSSVPASSEPDPVPEEPESSEPDPDEDDDEEEPDDDYSFSGFVSDEKLSVTVGGRVVRMDAGELVAQVVESETRGNLHIEALKAHAVASYTYIKYNNRLGISPTVGLKSSVSANVYRAVDGVLGEAVYYNGSYCNTVYHSVSAGYTASAASVWGNSLPYLVPVESPYDDMSPYYSGSYSISESAFAQKVLKVYGIDLYDYSDDPDDWIEIDVGSLAPGDYVGAVLLGGRSTSRGGTVSSGSKITGRGIREQVLGYSLRSTAFDVSFNGSSFVFTTRGYGHGVGMSQWGAHYFATQEGYDYVDILTHYYTGTTVR